MSSEEASAQNRSDRVAVVAVVVVRIDVSIVEVQVPRVVRVVRIERRRPVVAVRTLIVETRFVAVARRRQEKPRENDSPLIPMASGVS